jgi:hypothetical protein
MQKGLQQGLEQGLEQGLQQATRENILDLLNLRFGVAPAAAATRLTEITDLDILRTLLRQAATAENLSTFEHFLATIP